MENNLTRQRETIISSVQDDVVASWLSSWIEHMNPMFIEICDGSEHQNTQFCDQMKKAGRMIKLNESLYDNCWLCRSDPNDVARTEDRTFICSINKEDAGPTNNWMSPSNAKEILGSMFKNTMMGRTMYVIPFCMGDPESPVVQYGIQLTDSLYVAISMRSMARIVPISQIEQSSISRLSVADGQKFVRCVHSVGSPLNQGDIDVMWPCNKEKYICHFPETNEIISYGSGYGGNALLGKKCLALRIASNIGKRNGWLAEHMLILKMTHVPTNRSIFIAAAFPSACGKTNLAMLQSSLTDYKIECVGDDIAWLYVNQQDNKLYGTNPENGFFGVLPGTSDSTNPVVMRMIRKNTIFTNVGLTPDFDVWWEGKTDQAPQGTITWDNEVYDRSVNPDKKVAHPNSRFTTQCRECDILAPEYFEPLGVPISAIIFGGRRSDTIPLVSEAKDWAHGVLFGASLSSETTAAATGRVGVIRNDPFAMLPFCGYNMRDYFHHWLEMGKKTNGVKFYMVNWFRKDTNGKFIWPGFGKNIYVLRWIFERVASDYLKLATDIIETPFGTSPVFSQELLTSIYGSKIPKEVDSLFHVNETEYSNENQRIREYFSKFTSLRLTV